MNTGVTFNVEVTTTVLRPIHTEDVTNKQPKNEKFSMFEMKRTVHQFRTVQRSDRKCNERGGVQQCHRLDLKPGPGPLQQDRTSVHETGRLLTEPSGRHIQDSILTKCLMLPS